MKSKDMIVMIDAFKKIFSLLDTVAETVKGIQKIHEQQEEINIFLVKRIERLEKKEKVNLN
jgi:hypothetical protein